ncbi:hypothetical protein BKA82DRAFT_3985166, partial [Pisolithus tinctorius]
THVVEVQYFTCLAVRAKGPSNAWIWKNVVVVTMFSPPSPTLFKLSYQTIYSCQCLEDDMCVINVTLITGVVGMALHRFPDVGYCYFMVERPGLDIATFGVSYEGEGIQDDMADDEDRDD